LFFIGFFLPACIDNSTGKKIVIAGGPSSDYQGEKMYILEDLVHSERQNSSIKGEFSHLEYNRSHGFYNAFQLIRHRGFEHHQLVNGRLEPEILSQYDIVFINLVDSSHPQFSEKEIEAVEDYVKQGGGLFCIIDHTNVYESAAQMEPLLSRFGFSLPYELACDQPEFAFKQYHWLLITRFASHYITNGLEHIGLLAAGPIVGPGSVAWTSEEGFSDFWDPDNPPSYWGNFRQDPEEPTKSNSILNALEFGDGRIVVVGDQNVFGNAYLGVGDNIHLLMNIVEWLSKNEKDFSMENMPFPEIGVDQRTDDNSIGDSGLSGYLSFYGHLSRQGYALNRAYFSEPETVPDILIALEPQFYVSNEDKGSYQKVLENDKILFLVADVFEPTDPAIDMINEFWSEIVFRNNAGEIIEFFTEDPVTSEVEILEDVQLMGNLPEGTVLQFPHCKGVKVEDRNSVVAWLEDDESNKCDLLVKKDNFYLFLQPALWQNSAIRNGKQLPETEHLMGIYLIEKVLLYLEEELVAK
jgi:hypothetical protein